MKKLGFGFMRLPLLDQNDPASIDLKTVKKMVDVFLARGFTYFDTAYPYHKRTSESAIKETLTKRYPRDSFFLADKMPLTHLKNKMEQKEIFQQQLEKCGVDYFDYYMLHNLGAVNYEKAQKLGSFTFIEQKKQEGLIRKTGFSYHDRADILEEILSVHPEIDFVQLQINYLDWENDSIQSKKCYEVAQSYHKPVIVMEPVKGGNLVNLPEKAQKLFKELHPGLSIPSWGVRFAASLDNVTMVLSGMSNMTQLLDNTGYMQVFKAFNQEELAIVKQAAQIINESIAISCTGCDYCTEGCPQNIAIPKYFTLFNTEKLSIPTPYSPQKVYYNNYIQHFGKASDCISCGQCEKICPQHLPIIKHLKDVRETFEES